MGLAARFSKRLHAEIGAYAAWLPVMNSFELGDYGLIGDGVFQRIGNIGEFDVGFTWKDSSSADIDFASEGTKRVNLQAGAEVNVLPAAPIDAKVRIELGRKGSYYARAVRTTATEMTNIAEVARGLAVPGLGWRRRYRVVSSVITGHDCLVVTANADHAAFELSGRADVLQQLGLGGARAGVSVTKDTNIGFSVVGASGAVGLRLFKLKWFGDGPKLLGPDGEAHYELETADELEDDV